MSHQFIEVILVHSFWSIFRFLVLVIVRSIGFFEDDHPG
jgi:hypothetical protein